MRETYVLSAEFVSPEIGTLTVKKGTKLVKAFANAEAYDIYRSIFGEYSFDTDSDDKAQDA